MECLPLLWYLAVVFFTPGIVLYNIGVAETEVATTSTGKRPLRACVAPTDQTKTFVMASDSEEGGDESAALTSR